MKSANIMNGNAPTTSPLIRDWAVTGVWFQPMSDSEIHDYAASGEPMDKAGAYAIQGLASKFIEKIEGCYFNVVGLPLSRLLTELYALGWTDHP